MCVKIKNDPKYNETERVADRRWTGSLDQSEPLKSRKLPRLVRISSLDFNNVAIGSLCLPRRLERWEQITGARRMIEHSRFVQI